MADLRQGTHTTTAGEGGRFYPAYRRRSDEEGLRLRLCGETYDDVTTALLRDIPGRVRHFVEFGPGHGSVCELAASLWPEAELTAVGNDDCDALGLPDGCRWIHHDLNIGPPNFERRIDVAFARSVVHLLADPEGFLAVVAEQLAEGGRLVLQTFDFGPVAQLQPDEPCSAVWQAMLAGGATAGIHVNWLGGLADACERSGLTVESVSHSFPISRAGAAGEYWARSLELSRPFLVPEFISEDDFRSAVSRFSDNTWMAYPGLTSVVAVASAT